MYHNHPSRGFTLIELLLAMTFVSFLLIFMTLTLVQMMRTYDKGLTIKQVNQAGRTITDDIARSIRGEQPGGVILGNVANGYLCVGNVMYIWNPVYKGPATNPTPNPDLNRYNYDGAPPVPITLARQVVNNPSQICNNPLPVNYTVTRNADNYSLLGDRARVLWAGTERSSDGHLVKLVFAIGTYDTTEAALPHTDRLNTPHYSANFLTCHPGAEGNYCAFSEFSTVVYLPNER